MGMTGLPPGEFSLTSPGTKNASQVSFSGFRNLAEKIKMYFFD